MNEPCFKCMPCDLTVRFCGAMSLVVYDLAFAHSHIFALWQSLTLTSLPLHPLPFHSHPSLPFTLYLFVSCISPQAHPSTYCVPIGTSRLLHSRGKCALSLRTPALVTISLLLPLLFSISSRLISLLIGCCIFIWFCKSPAEANLQQNLLAALFPASDRSRSFLLSCLSIIGSKVALQTIDFVSFSSVALVAFRVRVERIELIFPQSFINRIVFDRWIYFPVCARYDSLLFSSRVPYYGHEKNAKCSVLCVLQRHRAIVRCFLFVLSIVD